MVSCCYQTDRGGETKGRRGGLSFYFNLPSLPNTLALRENPPSSRGSEDEERKIRNGPFDHALSPSLLQPLLFQTTLGPPPHLKSAWSLGKEMELGEEHEARTNETSLPLSTSPPAKLI